MNKIGLRSVLGLNNTLIILQILELVICIKRKLPTEIILRGDSAHRALFSIDLPFIAGNMIKIMLVKLKIFLCSLTFGRQLLLDTCQDKNNLLNVGCLINERAQSVVFESVLSIRVFQYPSQEIAVDGVVDNTFPQERLRVDSEKQEHNREKSESCGHLVVGIVLNAMRESKPFFRNDPFP